MANLWNHFQHLADGTSWWGTWEIAKIVILALILCLIAIGLDKATGQNGLPPKQ